MTMDMTVKEYFEDEENMNRVVDEMIAREKPYNDKYNELIENTDNIFYDIIDYVFNMVIESKKRFNLHDYMYPYNPKEWNGKYDLAYINVMFDILISMGKIQRSVEYDGMFTLTEYLFLFKYNGINFAIEALYGQGETHKIIRVIEETDMYTRIDIEGLKKHEKEQREKYEKESANQ